MPFASMSLRTSRAAAGQFPETSRFLIFHGPADGVQDVTAVSVRYPCCWMS